MISLLLRNKYKLILRTNLNNFIVNPKLQKVLIHDTLQAKAIVKVKLMILPPILSK